MNLYHSLRQRIADSFGCGQQKATAWAFGLCAGLIAVAAGLVWLWTYLMPLAAGWDIAGLAVIIAGGLLGYRLWRQRAEPLQPVVNRATSDDQPTIELEAVDTGSSQLEPPSYQELRHWKSFAKEAAGSIAVMAGSLVVIIAAAVAAFRLPRYSSVAEYVALAAIVVGLVALFAVGRARAAWKLRPITCQASDGRLLVHQTGSRRWILFGSPPDTYPLDEISLTTPPQTFWETYFFRNSNTIVLEGEDDKSVVLRDVINVEKLIEIQKYRDELTRNQVRLAEQQLAATNRSNELLQQLLDQGWQH